jgi:hypothetical protein
MRSNQGPWEVAEKLGIPAVEIQETRERNDQHEQQRLYVKRARSSS